MTDSAITKKQAFHLDPAAGVDYPRGLRHRRLQLLAYAAGTSSAAAKAEAPPPPAPVFYPLDTFTVNLGDADRVLYVGITLRLKDEATRARLNDYLPEVRSRLLLLFSRQDASALATDVGKQKLVDAIKQTLATPLVNGQPKQEVTDVLYTAFILR